MSEFIAEAQVLITPNTGAFRATLVAELAAIQRTIPGVVIPVSGFDQASLRTAAAGVASSATEATVAVGAESKALTKLTTTSLEAAGAQRTLAATQAATSTAAKNAERGVFTQVASLAGLRGAVLGANSAFIVGAAGAIAFFKSLQLAAGVEQDLATFRVTVGATADELSKVADEARLLGRDIALPGVGARDAVQAMLALAKAGLTVQASMDAARGVLQLATAAEIDNASAATLVANALNAFGLAGNQAVNVADLLANAANASQGSIEDMGIALRQVAATANQVGLSAQDTVLFLTQLAKAGIAGSDAGTTLRVALSRLVSPTTAVREEIEKLELKLRDVQGNLRPDIFIQVGQALQGVDRAAQDNSLAVLFGQNAQRVGAILSRQTVPALRDTQEALSKQGTAADVAAAKNEGLAGSVENAKNQFAAFSIEIGQLASPLASLGLDTVALLFGTLADSLHDIHESWKQQIDDLEQLGGEFKDLSDSSGFTDFVNDVNEGGKLFQQDFENAGSAVRDFSKDLLGLNSATASVNPPVITLTKNLQGYVDAGQRAGATTLALANSMDELAKSTAQAATPQAKLGLQIESARAGGDDSSLLSALEEREQNLQQFIDRLSDQKQTKAVVATLTKANQDLANTREEIQSLLDQRAQDTERAAKDAQTARDKADSAFLDLLGGRRDKRERFISQAEGTESLKDDINLRVRFIALLQQQIDNVRKTVQDAQAKASALASLTAQIVQIGNELKNLRRQQREAVAAAAEDRQARIERSIQLDIDLAQTVGNVQGEIRARNRLINLLKKQLGKVKQGTNAYKELRNAIAEQLDAINDLKKTSDESSGKSAAQFLFEQLQAQQGFASNLLGNLIPSGQTGGLVGNPSPAGAVTVATQEQDGKKATGPTGGQANTTNAILRQILRAINNANRGNEAPEAKHQRRVGSAALDGAGGIHGI